VGRNLTSFISRYRLCTTEYISLQIPIYYPTLKTGEWKSIGIGLSESSKLGWESYSDLMIG
jgi:hypothetical protein